MQEMIRINQVARVCRLRKKHNIPTFIDCAADVPPVENLFRFTKWDLTLWHFLEVKA